MGLIKEPLNVDFYFDGREMNDQDQKRVSDFLKKKATPKKAVRPRSKVSAKAKSLA